MDSYEGTKDTKSTMIERDSFVSFVLFVASCEILDCFPRLRAGVAMTGLHLGQTPR
jgi:hypothetical protein